MGKINIRAKAKSAAASARHAAQVVQAQIKKQEREKQLLHKTLTPKKTTSKKEKVIQKHKKLLNRFAQLRKERKEELERKKREKTAVVGDLHPLRDALPSLDQLFKLSMKNKAQQVPLVVDEIPEHLSAKQKIKKKREEFVKRVNSFEKLVKDKKFKENPREAIAAHIRNKYTTFVDDE